MALLLYAFCPTLVAHSGFPRTMSGAACSSSPFPYGLWRFAGEGTCTPPLGRVASGVPLASKGHRHRLPPVFVRADAAVGRAGIPAAIGPTAPSRRRRWPFHSRRSPSEAAASPPCPPSRCLSLKPRSGCSTRSISSPPIPSHTRGSTARSDVRDPSYLTPDGRIPPGGVVVTTFPRGL